MTHTTDLIDSIRANPGGIALLQAVYDPECTCSLCKELRKEFDADNTNKEGQKHEEV